MSELNIAKTLITKRKEKGITQNDLAEYIGVSKASVSKWETGQSYPDIAFLPQLAAYFNISVDELIGYEPQMIKEDIRKLYFHLAKEFTEKPFNDVMNVIRENTKKYYSCFPLLYYMGQLILNHHGLCTKDEHQEIVQEALDLLLRVKEESKDISLCKQANAMEATCYLVLGQPDKTIELLEDTYVQILDESNMLSSGYFMNNQPEKANEVLQVGLYQNLTSTVQNLLALLQIEAGNVEKADVIILRLTTIAHTFELKKLHPTTVLSIYVLAACSYVQRDDREKALHALQQYCDLATSGIFPVALHGDAFFDKIGDWLLTFDLGTAVPMNEKIVKQSIIQGITENPMLAPLSDDYKFKCIAEKLITVLGE